MIPSSVSARVSSSTGHKVAWMRALKFLISQAFDFEVGNMDHVMGTFSIVYDAKRINSMDPGVNPMITAAQVKPRAACSV